MNHRAESGVVALFLWAGGCFFAGTLLTILLLPMGLRAVAESKGLNMTGVVFVLFGPALILVSIGLVVLALMIGFRAEKGVSGPRQIPRVQIRSRFSVNEIGEMIFSNFEYDAPGGKLYVQVLFPDGHVEELATAWGVFITCGEGLWGSAIVDGTWLASFAPELAVRSASNSDDPYADQRGS